MTPSELTAVVNAIVPAVREYVKAHVAEKVGEIRDRVLVVETKMTAAPVATAPDIAADDIADVARSLLRKELDTLTAAAPPKIQKRILRDAQGQIDRVIEEPI